MSNYSTRINGFQNYFTGIKSKNDSPENDKSLPKCCKEKQACCSKNGQNPEVYGTDSKGNFSACC